MVENDPNCHARQARAKVHWSLSFYANSKVILNIHSTRIIMNNWRGMLVVKSLNNQPYMNVMTGAGPSDIPTERMLQITESELFSCTT